MHTLTANGVAIDDTFAEAFDMRATALVITAPTSALGGAGRDDHDGLRDLGYRLRLRGRHRPRAVAARNAGRPARRARADVRGLDDGVAETTAKPRRPMRADEPGLGLLRRAATRARKSSNSAPRSAFSATAGRSPRSSASAATGAFR